MISPNLRIWRSTTTVNRLQSICNADATSLTIPGFLRFLTPPVLFLCLHEVQISCPPLQRSSLFNLLLICFSPNILIFLVYFSHRHPSALFYSTYPKVRIYSELTAKPQSTFYFKSSVRPDLI